MHINPIIESKAELTEASSGSLPIVISSRIRLARNLSQFFFPGWANSSQRDEVLATCLNAIGRMDSMKNGTRLEMAELTELEKQILVERHLISRELQHKSPESGVYISSDQSCSIMVNEEDHLRIQKVRRGMHFSELWQEINPIDSYLEKELDYAFSDDFGYLTACPTNLGTGIRASAMLHLPGLVIADHMEKVVRTVNHLGIAVRGLFGEGSEATGSLFQISNQQTLGESETHIIDRLTKVLDAIIEQEQNAREKLLEDSPAMIHDKLSRAAGILQSAYLLNSEESMSMLSLLRLAVDLHFLPEHFRCVIDRFFIETQPGHVQYQCGKATGPQERDEWRATQMRNAFASLPSLDFNK